MITNYGELTIISERRVKDKIKVTCSCSCGVVKEYYLYNLKNGHTKSCGCLRGSNKTHGYSNTRVYYTHRAMLRRCNDVENEHWKSYGGRGISVCNDWLSVKVFCDWAMENGYKNNLQIDRINNEGNYEPNNCRFVTAKENASNTRSNKYVLLDGVKLTSSEASRQLGLKEWYLSNVRYGRSKNRWPERLEFI